LVNGRGLAPAAHARLSGGGLVYNSYSEFREALELLAREPELARDLGERGRAYVRAHFGWPRAIDTLLRFLWDIEQWLKEGEMAAL
jgi:glycosyltransferase involved in cell wall biosynthesis